MKNKILLMLLAVVLAMSAFEAAAQNKQRVGKQIRTRTQNVRVELTERGYRPENFRLRKNTPARVTFIRKTNDDCGRELVIPAYNIKRELPLNRPVTVSFTPRKTGIFNFTCGMDMLRGKVIVQ